MHTKIFILQHVYRLVLVLISGINNMCPGETMVCDRKTGKLLLLLFFFPG